MRAAFALLLVLAPAGLARAQTVLTMEAAIAAARRHAPELTQSQASVEAARARIDVARAPLLPQLNGAVGFERSTYNGALSIPASSAPSIQASNANGRARSLNSLDMRNRFTASLRASQLIYDFGQSHDGLRSAEASARAQVESAKLTLLDVEYQVRSAFLAAAARKALVQVAQETLDNQQRHFDQIQGFVEVGTRPAIDLAQSRTEVANARLTLVRAQNDYAVAKTQLERAMGFDPGDYEVSTELPAAEPEESAGLEKLLEEAQRSRPEFAALQYRLRAQELALSASESADAPRLELQASVDEVGAELDAMAFNVGAGLTLSWPIYQGGAAGARVREARAELTGLQIQRELLRSDARLELERALLSLKAAQAALEIAEEVVVNARELLTLAEGRYNAGVGNVIELGDAQLVLSNAQAQRVSASYELGQARLSLRRGLGR